MDGETLGQFQIEEMKFWLKAEVPYCLAQSARVCFRSDNRRNSACRFEKKR